MKCLVKTCKNRSLLMTVELCYPCSQLVEQGNDFKPDWDTVKPYIDRIKELEAQLKKHMSIKPKNINNWSWLTAEEVANLPIDWNKLTDDECTALSQLIIIIEIMIYEKNNPSH